MARKRIHKLGDKCVIATVVLNGAFRTDFTRGRKLVQATSLHDLGAVEYKNEESAKRAIRKRRQQTA